MVRQRSAKPLSIGSIPIAASINFLSVRQLQALTKDVENHRQWQCGEICGGICHFNSILTFAQPSEHCIPQPSS